jgi:hypothetical protein
MKHAVTSAATKHNQEATMEKTQQQLQHLPQQQAILFHVCCVTM